ncbi:MAG: sn-glycerol-3-phosphate ABC transporter ATP-binding protein UgpC, partial [Aliihoeflea sp.]
AVEILGADVLAHGQPADATQTGGEIIARLPGGTRVDVGDMLHFAIDPGMTHLFDAATGKRI